jgi:hypothetical protein
MDLGDVLDQMAFAALKPRELIARIAADLQPRCRTRLDIEKHVATLVARYGGRLGGMTRKNLVSQVEHKLRLNRHRQWEKTLMALESLQSKNAPSA